KATLAARKLIDFSGPLGWDASAVGIGRTSPLKSAPEKGVEARLRKAQPLVELRAPFEMSREELEAVARGAKDVNLDPVRDAARAAAHKLRGAGVDGPYAIALGPRCYTGLTKTTISGFPVIEHVRKLLDGPIIWAPAVDGAVVLSVRGGDFELVVGQDFSIVYLDHTATVVRLYLQESFTFRVLT